MPRDGEVTKKQVLAALKRLRTATLDEIVAKSKLGKTTVWRWITTMHEPENPGDREVHVVKWAYPPAGGRPMATYAAGPGEDAPCEIKKQSVAQRSKRYRTRAMADGRWADRQTREQAKYWADRALKRRDPMIEALYGPPKQPKPMEAS